VNVDQLGIVLLAGAAVLLVAVVAVRWTTSKAALCLLYLGLGLLIGEKGIGLRFDDAELTGVLGYCALILILAEGGLTTRWDQIRPSAAAAGALATVGICVSVGVVAVAARLLLGLDWSLALLVGAVVSSTDAAAVFSVLRQVPLPGRLIGLLEAESGFNDAPVVIAVVALTEFAGSGGAHPGGRYIGEAVLSWSGAGWGWHSAGWGGCWLAGPACQRPVPLAVLGPAFAAFGAATCLRDRGSSPYLCALVLGNVRRRTGRCRSRRNGLAGPGSAVRAARPAGEPGATTAQCCRRGCRAGPAAGRPALSCWLSGSFRFRCASRRSCPAGLRGAAPIVLTTIPMAEQVPGSTRLFDLVFVLVAVFTLPQADPAVRRPAAGDRRRPAHHHPGRRVSPLDFADVLRPSRWSRARWRSRLHCPTGQHHAGDPRRAGLRATAATMLRHGDLIVAAAAVVIRPTTAAQVSAGGKLADWRTPVPATGESSGGCDAGRTGDRAGRHTLGTRRARVPSQRPPSLTLAR
jgi:cell volume regulation protein A